MFEKVRAAMALLTEAHLAALKAGAALLRREALRDLQLAERIRGNMPHRNSIFIRVAGARAQAELLDALAPIIAAAMTQSEPMNDKRIYYKQGYGPGDGDSATIDAKDARIAEFEKRQAMDNAAKIAAGLTKAQRAALLIMPDPPFGLAYEHIWGNARVRLFALLLLEYLPTKTATPKMCLTPLGLAVHAILAKQEGK